MAAERTHLSETNPEIRGMAKHKWCWRSRWNHPVGVGVEGVTTLSIPLVGAPPSGGSGNWLDEERQKTGRGRAGGEGGFYPPRPPAGGGHDDSGDWRASG
eukprot:6260287-Amphidinium_carterae.2